MSFFGCCINKLPIVLNSYYKQNSFGVVWQQLYFQKKRVLEIRTFFVVKKSFLWPDLDISYSLGLANSGIMFFYLIIYQTNYIRLLNVGISEMYFA